MAHLPSLIVEFYGTSDPLRRTQLDQALTEIRKSGEAFEASFDLLDFVQPTVVQHFGASVIYETIRNKWEDCIANEQIASKLKGTLIEKLTLGAHFQNQSVTNKLSSSLALFALYCIPDVWPEPVRDLTRLWACQPELLLRVLAELAAEFHHVQMPLKQRSLLKSSLQKMHFEVMNVIELVLQSEDASPSLKNAAIECVEQWLTLPSVELLQWQPILKTVLFSTLNDFAALARMFTVIASHEDVQTQTNMALDITAFVAHNICPVVGDRLRAIGEGGEEECEMSPEMEDIRSLLFAIINLISDVLRPLLIGCTEESNAETLASLCSFFSAISSWPGRYAVDEVVSDAPDAFWELLKDDLTSAADEKITPEVREKVLTFCRPLYASMLQSAIEKLTFLPCEQFQKRYNEEQRDCFESYRRERREAAMHAFVVVGHETLTFLDETLQKAIETKDCCRAEAVLLLFERVADYLSEVDLPAIERILQLCTEISTWQLANGQDESRLGVTLMRLLYSLSHLVLTSDNAADLGGKCIHLALSFLGNPNVSAEALNTLEHFAEDRCSELTSSASALIERCYGYFACEQNARSLRLRAMKCVGFTLSLYDAGVVLNSLDSILAPRLVALQSIAEGRMPSTSQSIASLEEECLFELGVFSVLIASIQPKIGNRESDVSRSPVFVAMRQCVPLLQDLLRAFKDSGELVEKVCDALRSGLMALGEGTMPFLDTYCDLIGTIIFLHPVTACKLAKAVFILGEPLKLEL
ncbi:unnamed protein product [Toxocara canis]|uniref:Xpo1 domain-containing protein n=1 Tax=Toxocara canis TaxID=6265 RepID=A0A183V5C3_TOXCA|nr:unnamed protein product [Toxocara canis]